MLHLPTRVLERAVGSAAEGMAVLRGDELLYWNRAARRMLGGRGIRPPIRLDELEPGIRLALTEGDLSLLMDDPGETDVVELDDGFRLVVFPDEPDGHPHVNRLLEAEQQAVVGQLAEAVAREIGAPLLGIQAAADRLLRGGVDSDEEREAQLRAILDQSHRISKLSRQLVNLAAPGRSQIAPVGAGALLREAASLVLASFERADIELTLDLPEPDEFVRADRGQLQQVLLNLLLNARSVLEAGGTERRVHLSAEGANGFVRLRVCDSGPGVDPEDESRIFLPFTSRYGGTGLGLPMSRQILSEMDGSLHLEDGPLGGACFTVTLRKAADG
jgi:signal transduction histidine kinase